MWMYLPQRLFLCGKTIVFGHSLHPHLSDGFQKEYCSTFSVRRTIVELLWGFECRVLLKSRRAYDVSIVCSLNAGHYHGVSVKNLELKCISPKQQILETRRYGVLKDIFYFVFPMPTSASFRNFLCVLFLSPGPLTRFFLYWIHPSHFVTSDLIICPFLKNKAQIQK